MNTKVSIDKINEEIEQLKEKETIAEENKKRVVSKLLEMKQEALDIIKKYKEEISERRAAISEINDAICSLQGHSFSEWEELPDRFVDRSWYYTRSCNCCGLKEKTEITPSEYVVKDQKTGKVLTKIKRY